MSNFLSHKMNIHQIVLCALMLNEITREIYAQHLHQTNVAFETWHSSSKIRFLSQHDLDATLPNPQYLASTLDRDNVGCCFADQDIHNVKT